MISNSHRFRYRFWYRLILSVTILAMVLGGQAAPATVARAAGNTLELNVISARSDPRAFGGAGVVAGANVADYQYIINIDNTGTTEQRSPGGWLYRRVLLATLTPAIGHPLQV